MKKLKQNEKKMANSMEAIQNGFHIRELVPPETYNKLGVSAWWMIDPKIPVILALLKKKCNNAKVIINNYGAGGTRRYCGYRPRTYNGGADDSQHNCGRAFDVIVEGYTADQVRAIILANEKEFMAAGLTRIEDGSIATGWTHGDCAWTGLDHILIVGGAMK